MASNLNKAFMRAYAKDSGRPAPAPTGAAPENPQPASVRALNAHPTTAHPTTAHPTTAHPITAQPATTQPSNAQPSNAQPAERQSQSAARSATPRPLPASQPAGQAPIATPHLTMQSPAPAQVIRGRYVQKPAPAASVDPSAAIDAASVWQRIDAAHTLQPPHIANPPSRPIATAVGVGANSGPKRMQAGASASAAATARTADLRNPQSIDLPLLPDQPEATPIDPESVETRRRTVADFLYSAGKVPGSAIRTPVSATAAAATVSVDTHAGASLVTTAAVFSGQGRAATMPTERIHAPAAAAAPSPLYAASPAHSTSSMYAASTVHVASPVHAPVKLPEPGAIPGAVESPTIPAPSKRAGQILRVDVPTQAGRDAADAGRAPSTAARAIDEAMLDQSPKVANVGAPASSATIEQRRTDRAHELCEAEQKLRRSTHKIFNPVWEVDSLQWPGVCDKLMEHRAESMAQVAAHLKAACQDGLSILGVTSPTSGEGRTTVACCLARLAASHGLSVALVDLDLDHPTLCLQTNLEVEHDWRDCLDGDIALEEVAVHSIDDQLTLLPLKDRSDRPELLASDMGIADLLDELSESFELVIVDACRMNSAGNVITGLAAAQIFDAAIVVVDRRNSHQERIEDAVRALQQTGVGSIGIVDNFSM